MSGKEKRRRQKANKAAAKAAAEVPLPSLSDADLDALLAGGTVYDDCEHASTRTTADGSAVLLRCAIDVAVGGACPVGCDRFERRRVGGPGFL